MSDINEPIDDPIDDPVNPDPDPEPGGDTPVDPGNPGGEEPANPGDGGDTPVDPGNPGGEEPANPGDGGDTPVDPGNPGGEEPAPIPDPVYGQYIVHGNRVYVLIDSEVGPSPGEQWSFIDFSIQLPEPPVGAAWQAMEPGTGKLEDTSITLSLDMTESTWVSEHDYTPNTIVADQVDLFSTYSNKFFKHNALNKRGKYYNQNVIKPWFVDIVINEPPGITKRLVSLEWFTEAIDDFNQEFADTTKTFDQLMVYNRQQCSGYINITPTNAKRVENKWRMSQFRDIVLSRTSPFLDKRGALIQSNINPSPDWFGKRYFVDEFFVIRMLSTNNSNKTLYLYNVKPNLLQSDL